MSLTLFSWGCWGLAAMLGQWATVQLKQRVHVQVYLQREMTPSQIDATRLALSADPSVASAAYLDPKEAASELEAELGESFVSSLGYVPLPPVVDVVVRPDHATPRALPTLRPVLKPPKVWRTCPTTATCSVLCMLELTV